MLSRTTTFLLGLIAVCAVALPLQAVPIASFDFGSTGEVVGTGGGSGFVGNWAGDAAVTQQVAAPGNFFYAVPGGGLVAPTGAVDVTGNNNGALSRALASAPTGDVYFSFLTQWDAGAIGRNDFVVWFFNDVNGPNIGWKGDSDTAVPTAPDFVVRGSPAGNTYAPVDAAVGQPYFVVGHAYKDANANYNRYEIWVNPAFGDSATPQATSTLVSSASAISSIGVRSVNLDAGDNVLFGALRLGTTWDDVVPAADPRTQMIMFREGQSPTAGYSHVGAELRQNSNLPNTDVQLRVGNLDSNPGVGDMRTALGFDLSAIPVGATINGVQLTMTIDNGAGTDLRTIELHALLPGAGGANMIEGQVTWANRNAGSAWTTAGGDFDPTLLGSVAGFNPSLAVSGSTLTFGVSPAFLAAAQTAYDSGEPLELLLYSPQTEINALNSFVRFHSDDASNIAFRPKLTVLFTTPVPEPAMLGLLGLAGLAMLRRRRAA